MIVICKTKIKTVVSKFHAPNFILNAFFKHALRQVISGYIIEIPLAQAWFNRLCNMYVSANKNF